MRAIVTTHEINSKVASGLAGYLTPRTDMPEPEPGAVPVSVQVTAAGDQKTGEVRSWAIVLWSVPTWDRDDDEVRRASRE